jgi:hypothetical protein
MRIAPADLNTQKDIEDNKYLASILKQIQSEQLARDERKLPTLTLRERRTLKDSLERRRALARRVAE